MKLLMILILALKMLLQSYLLKFTFIFNWQLSFFSYFQANMRTQNKLSFWFWVSNPFDMGLWIWVLGSNLNSNPYPKPNFFWVLMYVFKSFLAFINLKKLLLHDLNRKGLRFYFLFTFEILLSKMLWNYFTIISITMTVLDQISSVVKNKPHCIIKPQTST